MKHSVSKFLLAILLFSFVNGYSTQRPSQESDDGNPFMDMASAFLQETLANQNGGGGGGGGLGGIASLVGSLMQPDGAKSDSGAGVLLSGLGSLLSSMNGGNAGGGGGGGTGFDPSIIGNVIEMFSSMNSGGSDSRQKRDSQGSGWESMLTLASTFLATQNQPTQHKHQQQQQNQQQQGRKQNQNEGDGLMSLLPMVMQAINSFSGPEGQKTQNEHKSHSTVLPPFLEKIHVMWDHFKQSELAEVLWQKSGINVVFKVSFNLVQCTTVYKYFLISLIIRDLRDAMVN